MNPNVREGHEALWQKYWRDEGEQFYDTEIVDPVQFPTEEEIRENIPACNGGFTPVNDPNLQGSWILAANVRGYDLTGASDYAEKARKIFRGLIALSGRAKTKGFVPRGSSPGVDVVYINSSVDQYTGRFYAMWRYWNSTVATKEEKRQAVENVLDSVRLIESFHDDVPGDDGNPTFYGDMSNLEESSRSSRLLHAYRTAHIMSGDEHWGRLYRSRLEAQNRRRLEGYPSLETFPPERPIANWGLWQTQAALRMLFETETDPGVKSIYERLLNQQAGVALPRLAQWRESSQGSEHLVIPDRWRAFWPLFVKEFPDHDRYGIERPWHHHHFARFVRDRDSEVIIPKEMLNRATTARGVPGAQLQFLAVALYAEDSLILKEAAKEGLPMLTTVDLTRPGHCAALKCFEIAYWRGVAVNLFPAS